MRQAGNNGHETRHWQRFIRNGLIAAALAVDWHLFLEHWTTLNWEYYTMHVMRGNGGIGSTAFIFIYIIDKVSIFRDEFTHAIYSGYGHKLGFHPFAKQWFYHKYMSLQVLFRSQKYKISIDWFDSAMRDQIENAFPYMCLLEVDVFWLTK